MCTAKSAHTFVASGGQSIFFSEFCLQGTMTRSQIPAFGNWDYSCELPITQYFESAVQAGLTRGHSIGQDGELLRSASGPVKPVIYHHHHHQRKVRKGGGEGERKQQRKQERACEAKVAAEIGQRKPGRAPKAVDEDLYKIPPELLCQKPKRKWFLKSLWPACLGLNCMA